MCARPVSPSALVVTFSTTILGNSSGSAVNKKDDRPLPATLFENKEKRAVVLHIEETEPFQLHNEIETIFPTPCNSCFPSGSGVRTFSDSAPLAQDVAHRIYTYHIM